MSVRVSRNDVRREGLTKADDGQGGYRATGSVIESHCMEEEGDVSVV